MKLIIKEQALKNNYTKLSRIGEIYYPIKANSSVEIIELLPRIGVKHTLISSSKPSFGITQSVYKNSTVINTLLDIQELVKLYRNGVRSFVFDSIKKLKKFIHWIEHVNDIEISIKLSLNSRVYSEFNTGAEDEDRRLMEAYLIENNIRYGYSVYINKAVRDKVDKNVIQSVIGTTKEIKFISIGGLEDSNLEWIEKLGREITESNIEFRIEPGEIMLDNVVDCKANIISINKYGKNLNVYIDISTYKEVYDTAAMGKRLNIESIGENLVYNEEKEKSIAVHIFGNSSDSNDYMGKYYINSYKDVDIGDTVLIKNIGAYFNRINHI